MNESYHICGVVAMATGRLELSHDLQYILPMTPKFRISEALFHRTLQNRLGLFRDVLFLENVTARTCWTKLRVKTRVTAAKQRPTGSHSFPSQEAAMTTNGTQ
jgi:hypothetical protein